MSSQKETRSTAPTVERLMETRTPTTGRVFSSATSYPAPMAVSTQSNIFQEVRSRISLDRCARYYGQTPNRSGSISCPFHRDQTPSLKLYPDHFYCFSCTRSGTVIDFVMQLFGLTPLDAVRRLDADFGLGLPLDRPATPSEQAHARRHRDISQAHLAFEAWRNDFITRLNACFRMAHLMDITDLNKLTDAQALALQMEATAEYLSNTLEHGSAEEQAQIFCERRKISQWIEKILNG